MLYLFLEILKKIKNIEQPEGGEVGRSLTEREDGSERKLDLREDGSKKPTREEQRSADEV